MTSPSPASVEPITVADRERAKCPTLLDLCYSIFMAAKQPNKEDGGPSDWFNDTLPIAQKLIAPFEARVVELEAALEAKDARIAELERIRGVVFDANIDHFKRAEAAEARATALLEALRPFDALLTELHDSGATPDDCSVGGGVNYGMLRDARAAINAGASNDR